MSTGIFRSEQLEELGPGFSFQVKKDGRLWPAFVIRYQGIAHCYLNVCAHAGLRLNGDKDVFFSERSDALVCRSHGAIYEADSGECTFGPCKGYSLIRLEVTESDGSIFYEDKVYELVT